MRGGATAESELVGPFPTFVVLVSLGKSFLATLLAIELRSVPDLSAFIPQRSPSPTPRLPDSPAHIHTDISRGVLGDLVEELRKPDGPKQAHVPAESRLQAAARAEEGRRSRRRALQQQEREGRGRREKGGGVQS